MSEFKVGDKVQPRPGRELGDKGLERVITHIGKKWVLYDRDGVENCMGIESFTENMKVVPDFFEEGKTYRKKKAFQPGGYWYFRVEAVRRHGNGAPVAFGVIGESGKAYSEGEWVLKDLISWTSVNWEEWE